MPCNLVRFAVCMHMCMAVFACIALSVYFEKNIDRQVMGIDIEPDCMMVGPKEAAVDFARANFSQCMGCYWKTFKEVVGCSCAYTM